MMHDEDESEEGFLDPKDLEVIDDQIWEPTDEDVLAYAMKLGFDVENDPDELFEVAYFYLKTPLPEGWKRAIYKETGELMYINMEDGEIEITTEIEEIAHECYLKKKEEYIQREELKKKESETKVVPRTKIPPLNSNKSANASVNTSQKLNPLSQSQKSGIVPQGKEKPPFSFSNNDNSKSDLNLTDNSDKDISHIENKILPVGKKSAIRDNDSGNAKEKEMELQKELLAKEKELKKETKNQLEKDKTNYFDQKILELKEYEKEIREKYEIAKTSFDKKEELLKQKIIKDYNNRLNSEKAKQETQQKDKLALYESQLKSSHSKEIEKHKKQIQKEAEDKQLSQIQNNDKEVLSHSDIISLQSKRESLKELISVIRKEKEEKKSKLSSHQSNFNYSKQLIEEKAKLDKNSILKQHQLDIKQIEKTKQDAYNKRIELSKQMITQKSINLRQSALLNNSTSQNPNQDIIDPMKSRILEGYSKSLDNDYKVNCQTFNHEFELSQSVEVQNFIEDISKKKDERIKQYSKSINELEKEYYASLSSLRNIAKKNSMEAETEMNKKFDLMLNSFDDMQKSMYPQSETLIDKVLCEIRNIIVNETEVNAVEIKTEELIRNVLDDIMIQCHKMKNAYELSEADYVYKSYLLRYLGEVASHLIKIILETPVSGMMKQQQQQQREVNDEVVNGIIKYAKDKLEQYKFKYNQNKDKQLYWFLVRENNISDGFGFQMFSMRKNNIQGMDLNKIQQSLSQKQTASERYDRQDNINDQYINNNHEEVINDNDNDKDKDKDGERDTNGIEPIMLMNKDYANNNNNYNEINCYMINSNNITVPLLPDLTLSLLSNDELGMYSDITLFLKNEYIKLIEMSNTYNTKLNMLIVDKIRLHTEECFNYINNNISNNKSRSYFKEKLNVLISNMNDYKSNFTLHYDSASYFKQTPKQSFFQSPSEDKMNVLTKSIGVNSSNSFNSNKNLNNKGDSDRDRMRHMNNIKRNSIDKALNVRVSNNYINSFNNFYTHYVPGQSLHPKMSSSFTHEFFNYKKNKYEVQSKLDFLKYRQNSNL